MNRRDRRLARRGKAATAPVGRPSGPLGRATALLSEGRHAEAEVVCRRVLAADRSAPEANRLLSASLREQGRLDEAMLAARRAITSAPRSAPAHTEIGAVLMAQDRVVEALRSFERALELDPDDADAHNRSGSAMKELGELDEALASFRRVAELRPEHPAPHANIAGTLARMGRYEEARAAYRAPAIRPDDAHVRFNRSFTRVATGDLVGGWEDQEFGFAIGERTPDRRPPVPRWDGSDLSDRTILVWREQGLGDEVRFASCYMDVIDHARHVVIECSPRLVPILRRSFPRATVRAQTFDAGSGAETTDFSGIDVHCPTGSLPRWLRRSIEDFPRHGGYLTADPDERDRWCERLSKLGEGLKVGIAWRSMNLATSRLRHYLTLDEFDPVLRLADIDLVNLQYGPAEQLEAELGDLEQRTGVVVHRWHDVDYTNDIDTVAALTSELDIVIGPGSFPTVLAGALGVPALMLTAPTPWTLGQQDEDPWFADVRHLVRAWDEPWQRVAEAAAEHVRQLPAGTRAGGAS